MPARPDRDKIDLMALRIADQGVGGAAREDDGRGMRASDANCGFVKQRLRAVFEYPAAGLVHRVRLVEVNDGRQCERRQPITEEFDHPVRRAERLAGAVDTDEHFD